MKLRDIEVGGKYIARVDGELVKVEVQPKNPTGGWYAINVETGLAMKIITGQRLRCPAGGVFVITYEGRYLSANKCWVENKAEAKRFHHQVAAKRFWAELAGEDQLAADLAVSKGAKLKELAK
jgi:hypothetical protein